MSSTASSSAPLCWACMRSAICSHAGASPLLHSPSCTVSSSFILSGSPAYGAKFGGLLASLAGFAYPAIQLSRSRAKWKIILWTLLCAVVFFALLLLLNMRQDPSHQTHIGRAFNSALKDGPAILWRHRRPQIRHEPAPDPFLVLGAGVVYPAFRLRHHLLPPDRLAQAGIIVDIRY